MSHLGRIVLVVAALLLLVVSSGTAAGLQIKSAGNPDQIPLGEAPLRFQVTDAQGAPVTGARVALEVSLPAVPHVLPSTVDAIATNEPGIYAAYVKLEQDGRWQVKVTAKAAGETATETLTLVAGTGQADHSLRRYIWMGVALLVTVVAGRVIWLRARRPGARKAS